VSFILVHKSEDLRYIYDVLRKGVKEHNGVSKVRYIRDVAGAYYMDKSCDQQIENSDVSFSHGG
jgi:hypothetical protein